MSIGKRLKEIRKDLELSQAKFADELSIHLRSYVSYEHEQRMLPENVIRKLMEMGYSADWLIGGEGNKRSYGLANDLSQPPYVASRKIPLLDELKLIESPLDKLPPGNTVLWPMLEGDPYAYAVKVGLFTDEGMSPMFSSGEVIIASPLQTVINNDKVIVKLKDERILFRVLRFVDDHVELIPGNPLTPSISIPASELVFAHKVIGSLKV